MFTFFIDIKIFLFILHLQMLLVLIEHFFLKLHQALTVNFPVVLLPLLKAVYFPQRVHCFFLDLHPIF